MSDETTVINTKNQVWPSTTNASSGNAGVTSSRIVPSSFHKNLTVSASNVKQAPLIWEGDMRENRAKHVSIDFSKVNLNDVVESSGNDLDSGSSMEEICNYIWTAWVEGEFVSADENEDLIFLDYKRNQFVFKVEGSVEGAKNWEYRGNKSHLLRPLRGGTAHQVWSIGALVPWIRLAAFNGGIYLV